MWPVRAGPPDLQACRHGEPGHLLGVLPAAERSVLGLRAGTSLHRDQGRAPLVLAVHTAQHEHLRALRAGPPGYGALARRTRV